MKRTRLHTTLLPFCLAALLLSGCKGEGADLTESAQHKEMNAVLEQELNYISSHYDELTIIKTMTSGDSREQKTIDSTVFRKALNAVFSMEAGRITDNPSYALDSFADPLPWGGLLITKNYHIRPGEKLPFKYLRMFKLRKEDGSEQYMAIHILRDSKNILFTSKEKYRIGFQRGHLHHIYTNIYEKVALSDPRHYQMQIEINPS